jgi:hypothetical protein
VPRSACRIGQLTRWAANGAYGPERLPPPPPHTHTHTHTQSSPPAPHPTPPAKPNPNNRHRSPHRIEESGDGGGEAGSGARAVLRRLRPPGRVLRVRPRLPALQALAAGARARRLPRRPRRRSLLVRFVPPPSLPRSAPPSLTRMMCLVGFSGRAGGAGGDRDVDKVGERLQGVGISDGSSSAAGPCPRHLVL